ncbi:DNA mismatch repair protein Mlh3 isoform X2 [Amia ocellicauda]|uniref:DNA mismatch repair protein Mlh3 isoform X2 n=1 Tax=Amia ocellicauda TaxID=2972642 RepID=UPI003464E868
MIKCLSREVQARLRSGIAIFSLTQCVEELLLNSIDAGATCVAVRVDIETCKVQVIDNGSGIDRENMERVGNRYFTSKCGSLEDLDNLRFHGFRGEAIASIAGLATLVEISSRTHQSVQTFVKVFKDGKGLDVYEADLARPAAGTTVVICNFFHNLPVRRKRLDPVLECERIRQRIEGISLMHPSVSFSLRNDTTGTMVVQLSKTRNTYFRFTQIYGLGKAQKLGEITCSHNQFEMSGFIGREGHYNSSMQFLFVNKRLLLKTRIHKLLHFLLKKVSVANRQNGSPTVSTALGSPKQRSGSELQGVYVINIKCHYSEYDVCMEPAKTLIEFRDWDSVLFCVEEGVKKFLTRENLVAELSPEDVHEFVYENALNDQLACIDSTQGGTAIGDPKSVLDFPRQTPEWKTLTSKTVHRSLAIGFNVTESMCMASEEAEIVKGQEEKKNSDLESVYHALKEKTLAPSETKTDETTSSHVPSSHSSQIKASENRHSSAPDTVNAVSKNTVFYESFNDSDCIDISNATTQLEDAAWRTSSDEDTVKPSANTNLGKECGHGRDPERSIESVASSHFSHFKTRSTFSNVMPFSSSNLELRTEDQTNVSGTTKVQLASTGFIKHVILKPHTNEKKSEVQEGLRRFCLQGPASAQDIFKHSSPAKEPIQTEAKEHTRDSSIESLQQPDTTLTVSADNTTSLEAPKRKISLVGARGTASGGYSSYKDLVERVTRPGPKLSLSGTAESLDRFRRIYGKQNLSGKEPTPQDDNNNQNAPDAKTAQEVSVNPENHEINDSVGSAQLNDSPLTLSEFTRMKPMSAQSSSKAKGSLATKLSKLKGYQRENGCSISKEPPAGISCPVSEGVPDNTLDSGSNLEKSIHSSPKTIPDMNKNPQLSEVGNYNKKEEYPGGAHPELNQSNKDISKAAQHWSPPVSTGASKVCDTRCSDDTAMGQSEEVSLCEVIDSPNEVSERAGCDPPSAEDRSGGASQQSNTLCPVSRASDWVERFDASVGKMVYINMVTGLSRYEAPPAGETRVPCVTDITTMAVNVVSNREDSGANESVWSLYAKWENPVFVRHPEVALDVSSGQADRLAVKIHNILYPYRFTKDMIHSMKVIQQVDKKFLACLIHTKDKEGANSTDSEEGNLLVLVDQHAAHERVRLENLIIDSYEAQPGQASGQKRLCSSSVSPPLEIDVTEEEFRMLRSCQPFLRDLGLEMTFAEDGGPRVLVGKVPVCFLEREANELRRGRQTVTKAIVEEYIREQIELLHSTGRVRGTLPLTVLKVLASQACHGAIKFNDSLSRKECCRLVESLSACQLPFQCAHGRPSMLPLADLDHLDTEPQDPPKPNLMKLRRMYRAWKLFGKP